MYIFPPQVQKDGTNGANYGTFTTGDAEYSKTYDCFSKAGVSRLKCSRKYNNTKLLTMSWSQPSAYNSFR